MATEWSGIVSSIFLMFSMYHYIFIRREADWNSLISCINTSFRSRYGRDSATPPVDSSEGNNTNYRNDVQLGDKDLIDIGEFFVFERPIPIRNS